MVAPGVCPARGLSSGISSMPTLRNLDHETDLGVKPGLDAARSVQRLGTTAKPALVLGNPEWTADMEYVWRMRTHDALQRLDRRAREQRRRANAERDDPCMRAELSRSAEWAEHRARAMALPRVELLATCGKRWRKIRCECGIRELPVGCDQMQLCERCSKRKWRHWRRRLTRAMDAHVRAARGEWHRGGRRGRLPGVYLITLTVPHSGSIAQDRERLARGWRGLTKRASAGGWWGAYALTYEVTPGRDGAGHVHVHVAAVSSWIPYDQLHAAWRSLTGAVVLDVSAPGGRTTRSKKAAEYLSKYVTKGIDYREFTGQKAGEILVAWRSKRKMTTSIDFWKPLRDRETRCTCCGAVVRSVGEPCGLQEVAPAAVLQAMAERIGWWIPRGGVQRALELDSC